MNKATSLQQIVEKFSDGLTLMIGGFLAVGTPENLVNGLLEKKVCNLTVIANDTGFPNKGIGKLIVNKAVAKAIVSHIGTNPETGRQMHAGELEVELVPQGTLAERIRSGGVGLGGFLTPTGIGTVVEKGKEKINVDGKEFLLEKPLRADIALIKAAIADTSGNMVFHRTARNFNPLMAMAADFVIVEAEKIVEKGGLDPDEVMLPGVFADLVIKSV